jgi:hypothetical protein
MEGQTSLVPLERIERAIILMRGEKVMLDSDLAEIYGVETKILNRAVKRNASRFPSDFMFQLTAEEAANLRCQIGTSSSYGGRRYLPYAFTEHGALMLANVLNWCRSTIRLPKLAQKKSQSRTFRFLPGFDQGLGVFSGFV